MRSSAGAGNSRPEILTPLQAKVLARLFDETAFKRHYYLTGGTALAGFHLHHRYSDDLDFFTHQGDLKAIPPLMRAAGKDLGLAVESIQASPGFLRFKTGGELLVDFVADVEFRVGSPELIDGFMVDNVKNIAVNKVGAILGRLDAKDYVDLHAILTEKNCDIFELLELAAKKDAGIDPFIWSSLIADVAKLELFPRMVKPVDRETLVRFFLDLRDRILDRLNPEKR